MTWEADPFNEPGRGREKRYGTTRWRAIRRQVLERDGHTCYIPSCGRLANVADHIDPVYVGMPDSEFYALANLRAACGPHNRRRGVAARLAAEEADVHEVARRGPVRFRDRGAR